MNGLRMCLAKTAIVITILNGCRNNSTEIHVVPSEEEIIFSDTARFLNTVNADGTGKRKLFNIRADSPTWSPDGRAVAGFVWDLTIGQRWLASFDAKSGAMLKLALVKGPNDFGFETYAWSPDGSAIAFSRMQGGFGGSHIYTVDANGGSVRQLTSAGFNIDPVWAPDGGQIAFQVRANGYNSCYIVNKDGSDLKVCPFRSEGLVVGMSWSPDGSRVTFDGPADSSLIGSTSRDIFITERDRSRVVQVTHDGVSGVPSWSPDGQYIAFVSKRHGGLNGFVMRSDGSDQRRLTSHGKVLAGPLVWSPNGTQLLYSFDTTPQVGINIGVARLDGSKDAVLEISGLNGFSWKR